MKHLFTLLFLSLWILPIYAQVGPTELKPIAREIAAKQANREVFAENGDLFKLAGAAQRNATAAHIKNATTLELQPTSLQKLLKEGPANLKLSIPTNTGHVTLQLFESNIFSDGFNVTTSDGRVYAAEGKHYRGIVEGDMESVAAISIFKDEVMGMVLDKAGNNVLGKIKGTANDYVLYNDDEIKDADPFECHTNEKHLIKSSGRELRQSDALEALATKCVRAYWEADYEIYQNKGSVSGVTNYLTGLFNQSKIIYDNDGISITLQQIYVWTGTSPYSGQTNTKLSQFRSYRTSFNGDLAHLIHMDGGGGVAYVNALCSSGYNYGVSNINSTYSNYPTYSWSVMVVTHEQGHIMGSQHTHDCVWNGNNTAIDHCGGNSCSALESAPSGGGTIMSYCHLTSTGINLSKGFGPQPKARIQSRINDKSCLASECSAPPQGTYTMFKNRATGLQIDGMSRTTNGANAGQWATSNSSAQQWMVETVGSYVKLKNRATGLYLDGMGRTANGSACGQYSGGSSYNQQWTIETAGSYVKLRNRGTGLYADGMGRTANGADLGQWSSSTSTNQQWSQSTVSSTPSGTPEVAALAPENTNDLTLSPNPAKSEVKVIFKSERSEQVIITLLNTRGLKMKTYTFKATAGTNQFAAPLPASLTDGLYFITVNGKTAKLLIKK